MSEASEMHGKAARVAGAISGESRMKLISQREPKVLLSRSFDSFQAAQDSRSANNR